MVNKSTDPRDAQQAIHAEQAEVASKLALLHDMQVQLTTFRQGLQSSIEGRCYDNHKRVVRNDTIDKLGVLDFTADEEAESSSRKNTLASLLNSECVVSHSVETASLYSKLSELDQIAARIQQEAVRLSEQLKVSTFPARNEEREAVIPMLNRDETTPRFDLSSMVMRFHTAT